MLTPLSSKQWDFKTAAHLLNRAGFGGTPADIERLAALGPQEAVSSLLDFEKTPDDTKDPEWAKPDPTRAELFTQLRNAPEEERRRMQQQRQREDRERIMELRGWWLQRMAHGPRPLQEKLTLFWHGHFATSTEKVREPYFMWRQNELFRRMATGNWREMLVEVAKDPAMLLWLDQAQSRKDHPNENFAREVMELFALGEGHYTEKDITEAARALTGWSLDRVSQRFMDRSRTHDTGTKTVLGKTGNFDGEDVLAIIVGHPQAAKFITGKLWNFFAGTMPSSALNDALADVFRKADNNFKPVLRTMLLSGEFYAPDVVRMQVKSPVQWLLMASRQLERPLPPPLACNAMTRSLGQELFQPPNVKGWDGGLNWITTNNLLTRYNETATLVFGDMRPVMEANQANRPNQPAAAQAARRLERFRLNAAVPEKLFTKDELTMKDKFIAALERRFLNAGLNAKQKLALREFLDARGELDTDDVLGAIRLVMCTPDYQLT